MDGISPRDGAAGSFKWAAARRMICNGAPRIWQEFGSTHTLLPVQVYVV